MKALVFLLLLASCVASTLSLAKEPSAMVISNDNQLPDVRVIIDISGSMKQNDPKNLRRPALELLIQLFPEESKAGVWTFGQWVNNLVKSKPVNNQWREEAAKQAKKINSVALNTNIPEALLKAVDDIDNLDPNYQVHLILLTDGMVDISKSPAENDLAKERILQKILPKFRDAGVVIHTVALSKNADQKLMERLAFETGGLSAVAETAEDLTNIFLQAFDAAAPAEQVPLEGNTFLVDSSIEEFTALIFRKPNSKEPELISPDEKRHSLSQHDADIKWFQQQNYDLITVKQPYEGEWSIDAELEPNSRVTIVSNLSLQVNTIGKSIFVGDKESLKAALVEQGEVITRAEFLSLIDVSTVVKRRDDNTDWVLSLSEPNTAPTDGYYFSELDMLQKIGIYDISTEVDGKTFQRKQRQTVAVREAFKVDVNTIDGDIPKHEVNVFVRNPAIDISSTEVVASIQLPDGSEHNEKLSVSSDRTWILLINGIDQSGFYQVSFQIIGNKKSGDSFVHNASPITIEHHVIGSDFITLPPSPPQEEIIDKESYVETVEDDIVKDEVVKEEIINEDKTEEIVEKEIEEVEQAVELAEDEAEEGTNGNKIGLYGAIAIANLVVIGLIFLAFKMIKGSTNKSSILDEDDEEVQEEAEKVKPTDDTGSEEVKEVAAEQLEQETPIEEVIDEPEPVSEPVPDTKNEVEEESSNTVEEDVAIEANTTDEGADLDLAVDIDFDKDLDAEPEGFVEIDEEDDLEIDLDEGSIEEDVVEDIDDILDLPDDAIDIEPASEDDKK